MQRKQIKRLAFTLIELLVVVSIIGVLTAIILPNMMGMRKRARDSKRKASLNELKTALRLYYNDYQLYPATSGTGYKIVGCGDASDPVDCEWGSAFRRHQIVYMNQLPSDSNSQYHYERHGDDGFRAWIDLENSADGDIEKSHDACGISSDTNAQAYYVCTD